MAFGVVKWFNNAKGWGFIESDDGGEDIFVHYSQVKGDGFKVLRQGERVEFRFIDGPKGGYAEHVMRVPGQDDLGPLEAMPSETAENSIHETVA